MARKTIRIDKLVEFLQSQIDGAKHDINKADKRYVTEAQMQRWKGNKAMAYVIKWAVEDYAERELVDLHNGTLVYPRNYNGLISRNLGIGDRRDSE